MRLLSLLLAALLTAQPVLADITFNVTHTDNGAGWTDPTLGKARRDTLQAVLNYLNTILDEDGTIDYVTNQSDYNETGPIASASPRFLSTPNGFTTGNVFLHGSSGVDPNPASADGSITMDWGYSLSPGLDPPPNGQLDLYSVLLHEVTHSLGFLTRINGDGESAITNTDPGVYTTMDSFARVGNVAPASPLVAAGGDFVGTLANLSNFNPGVFFWGPAAIASTGGSPIRLFQSNPHGLGSGLSHTGILMGPSIANNVMKRTYSVRDLGMLRDFGWKIKPQPPKHLGPQKLTLLQDPGPQITRASAEINDDKGLNSRFGGMLGGLLLDVYPNLPRPVYDEEPSTAAAPGRSGTGELTQLNFPGAPGSIALQNGDGSHSSTGLTWISPWENFRMPARPDEKFIVAFRANPSPRVGGGGPGTFFDAVLGAPTQGIPGGAASARGIGLRLNASGPEEGMWQLFDGTGSAPRVEASGPLPRPRTGAPSGWYAISLELLQPRFDETTPTVANLLIDGVLVHSFTTTGGIGDNYVSFHAGPAASRAKKNALYLLDDIDISIAPWEEAPPVVTVDASARVGGAVGVPYSNVFEANGGTAPYEWWLDGDLPEGLVFADGVISGTPTESGSFSIVVSAVDYGFFVGEKKQTITIAP